MIQKTKPENFNQRFEVVSCFIEHDGHILLLRRHEKQSWGGRWGPSTGKLQDGESEINAVVREVKEESGLEIQPHHLNYFDKFYVNHGGYEFVFHVFHAPQPARPGVILNPYEHTDFAWVSPREAFSMELTPDEDEVIRIFYNLSP